MDFEWLNEGNISGQLNEMFDAEDPTVRRNIPFFGAVGPYVKVREFFL
jgi:hypothetical protein